MLGRWAVAATLAVSVAARTTDAQAAATASTITVGPVVALNIVGFHGDGLTGDKDRLGFSVGGQVRIPLGVDFLLTGVTFSLRGANFENPTGTWSSKYVEIPVLIGLQLLPQRTVRPYVMGGAQVGLLTACTVEVRSPTSSFSTDCNDPATSVDDSEDIDLAGVVGGGVAIPVGGSTLLFDARLVWGLRDIEKGLRERNRGLGFAAAWMIPLGRW